MDFSKYVLFTGAGFTKNFGAPLAKEMRDQIFNNHEIQSCPRIRDLLFNDYDYEFIYNSVITGDYTKEEKESLNNAIYEAYHSIDEIVAEYNVRTRGVHIPGVNKLIERFSGQTADMCGFFFTVNQDLFVERQFYSGMEGLDTLCIRRIPNNEKRNLMLPLEKQDFITLPTEEELIRKREERYSPRIIYYIKLHGSYGWRSSDGVNRFIIGKDKEVELSREPLLSYYFDLFKEVLSKPRTKLLVIGYGFRDKHINHVIADAVAKSGLTIYVISPSELSLFIENLKSAVNRH